MRQSVFTKQILKDMTAHFKHMLFFVFEYWSALNGPWRQQVALVLFDGISPQQPHPGIKQHYFS